RVQSPCFVPFLHSDNSKSRMAQPSRVISFFPIRPRDLHRQRQHALSSPARRMRRGNSKTPPPPAVLVGWVNRFLPGRFVSLPTALPQPVSTLPLDRPPQALHLEQQHPVTKSDGFAPDRLETE